MTKLSGCAVFAVLMGCASAGGGSAADTVITLSRGGDLSGIAHTVRISSSHGVFDSEYRRSDQAMPFSVRLSQAALGSTFRTLDSLMQVVPTIPVDTGSVWHICGDATLTHIELTRGTTSTVAQEECPHKTTSSTAYWARVNELFVFLTEAAR
jgi:hypothetical protein